MPTSLRAPFRLAASPSFYLVHHYGFLASLYRIHSHDLEDCPSRRFLTRSETMAETTPLLPRNTLSHDVPIFLCVCHSPWPFLTQKTLVAVRAIISAYLSVVFALDMFYVFTFAQRGKQFAFEASSISLTIQIVYYWMTTVGVCVSSYCINPLTSLTVLGTATPFGTLRQIASRGTDKGKISSPDTGRSFDTKVD